MQNYEEFKIGRRFELFIQKYIILKINSKFLQPHSVQSKEYNSIYG